MRTLHVVGHPAIEVLDFNLEIDLDRSQAHPC
jgi:hypothetical protein